MSYIVDYKEVSTIGLETSPVAHALAGLRANEARFVANKWDHEFAVESAKGAKRTIDWVNRVLNDERDIVISASPLEATEFEAEGIKFAYVFCEDGLSST